MFTITQAKLHVDSRGIHFIAAWLERDSSPINYRIAPEVEEEFLGLVIEPYTSNCYTIHPDYYQKLKDGLDLTHKYYTNLFSRLELFRDVNLGPVITLKTNSNKVVLPERSNDVKWQEIAHLTMLQVKHNNECGKDDEFTKQELVDMMKRHAPVELNDFFENPEEYQNFIDELKKKLKHITFNGKRKIRAETNFANSLILKLSKYKNLPKDEAYYLNITKAGNVVLDKGIKTPSEY